MYLVQTHVPRTPQLLFYPRAQVLYYGRSSRKGIPDFASYIPRFRPVINLSFHEIAAPEIPLVVHEQNQGRQIQEGTGVPIGIRIHEHRQFIVPFNSFRSNKPISLTFEFKTGGEPFPTHQSRFSNL